MSTHIHQAIGYAMPFEDFWKHLKLPVERQECLGDELDRLLGHTANLIYGGDVPHYQLISSAYIAGDKGVERLVMVVGNGDDQDHVLFFPSLEYKEKWYRFDDEMDWTFAREMVKDGGGIADYLADGIHPYEHERMDCNGVRVECPAKDNLWEFERDPALRPGVPEILRWWLLHTGMFDLDGVAALRPFRGLWWG